MNTGKHYRMYTQHNHEELSSEGTIDWTLMSETPPNLVPLYHTYCPHVTPAGLAVVTLEAI